MKVRRPIRVLETHAEVPLTQGKVALVSLEDVERVGNMSWCFHSSGYAFSNTGRAGRGEKHPVRLHRFILNMVEGDGRFADHINGDRLDCRRSNLREVTKKQNAWNKGVMSTNALGVRGVFLCKTTGRYRARMAVNGKHLEFGRFDTPEEASAVYEQKAKEMLGAYYRPLENAGGLRSVKPPESESLPAPVRKVSL